MTIQLLLSSEIDLFEHKQTDFLENSMKILDFGKLLYDCNLHQLISSGFYPPPPCGWRSSNKGGGVKTMGRQRFSYDKGPTPGFYPPPCGWRISNKGGG